MAMVIALGINNGFRDILQKNLLGASAHVSVLEKQPGEGIAGWESMAASIGKLSSVVEVAPSLYIQGMLSGPSLSSGVQLKGVDPDAAVRQFDMLAHLKSGSLARLKARDSFPGIVLGARLAQNTGMMQDSVVSVIIPNGEATPFGTRAATYRFRVVGIFESGFYELDNLFAYISLRDAQKMLGVQDVVNSLEVKLDDIYRAPAGRASNREDRSEHTGGNRLDGAEQAYPHCAQDGAYGDAHHDQPDSDDCGS